METTRQLTNFRETGVISRRAFVAMVALMVLVASGFTANTAEAANRYAVVGVENATHVTIRLQHKWGDSGTWTMDAVQPGGKKWFWWTYKAANDNHSPKFHVKFDSDLQPGNVFPINYDLKKNAAPAHEWDNASQYVFKYDGNRNYIDLYHKQ
jgi:hypothetical protein